MIATPLAPFDRQTLRGTLGGWRSQGRQVDHGPMPPCLVLPRGPGGQREGSSSSYRSSGPLAIGRCPLGGWLASYKATVITMVSFRGWSAASGRASCRTYDREPTISAVELEGRRGITPDAVHRSRVLSPIMSTTLAIESFWKGASKRP